MASLRPHDSLALASDAVPLTPKAVPQDLKSLWICPVSQRTLLPAAMCESLVSHWLALTLTRHFFSFNYLILLPSCFPEMSISQECILKYIIFFFSFLLKSPTKLR